MFSFLDGFILKVFNLKPVTLCWNPEEDSLLLFSIDEDGCYVCTRAVRALTNFFFRGEDSIDFVPEVAVRVWRI